MKNKSDLVNHVAKDLGCGKPAARNAVNAVLSAISSLAFEGGERLTLRGFGRFEARTRAPKKIDRGFSRNGQPYELDGYVTLAFTASPEQRRPLN